MEPEGALKEAPRKFLLCARKKFKKNHENRRRAPAFRSGVASSRCEKRLTGELSAAKADSINTAKNHPSQCDFGGKHNRALLFVCVVFVSLCESSEFFLQISKLD